MININDREKYLESKLPKNVDIEAKYRKNFERYATYLGNGIYQWKGITATDTALLFLMGVLRSENINFKEI